MNRYKLVAVVMFVVSALSWYAVVVKFHEVTGMSVYSIPELSVDDYMETEIFVEDSAIHLMSGCTGLTMLVSDYQAASIANGVRDRIEFRPGTHDLMSDILDNYGIEVLGVKVESMREGAYFAKLILKKDNSFFSADSRPSDAIAVAVRAGAPVYVSNALMEEYGEKFC
jgi:bifunctional DNase/RNase